MKWIIIDETFDISTKICFYGVTVEASAEGAIHLSSLLNAARGLAPTKKFGFVSKTFNLSLG